MKRQARPFVVETKRSRKAPTNLWASTPLLQQELAAASASESKADAIFADRSKEQAAEPARRILQSLVVEAPSAVDQALDSEEAEDALPRRRTGRASDDPTAEPARRGRPRRVVAPADADTPAASNLPKAPASTDAATARSRKLAAPKVREAKPVATPAVTAKALAANTPAAKAPASRIAAEPAALASQAVADADGAPRVARTRTPRNPAVAALLPGERWKRRLPQRLW